MILTPLALAALLSSVAAAPTGIPGTVTTTVTSQTQDTIAEVPTNTSEPTGTTTATVTTTTETSTTSITPAADPPLTSSVPPTPDTTPSPLSTTSSTEPVSTNNSTANSTEPVGKKTYNTTVAFPYDKEKIRGVNLGGWLLLESWITPTLFDKTNNDKIVDEYTFTKLQDKSVAQAALKEHWDTFITEKDFEEIAAAGLNHVRVPIGYWAYDLRDNETYIGGQDAYLEKSIGWARNHGIKVLIDLHGVPGSQNGFDNSGQVGPTTWHENPDNVQRSVDVIAKISAKYSAPEFADTVTAIGLLNEPAGFRSPKIVDVTKQFFLDAYQKARHPFAAPNAEDESGQLVVISDALVGMGPWKGGYMQGENYTGVALDYHYYQIFSNEEQTWNFSKRLAQACSSLKGKLVDSPFPVMSGEWSVAASDCAKYLNGRGLGARYDGTFKGSTKVGDCAALTGTGENFTTEYKDFLRKFWDVQTQLNEQNGIGWLFWTWKNEEAAEWSYKRGMELGFIPTKPTEHKYTLNDLCT